MVIFHSYVKLPEGIFTAGVIHLGPLWWSRLCCGQWLPGWLGQVETRAGGLSHQKPAHGIMAIFDDRHLDQESWVLSQHFMCFSFFLGGVTPGTKSGDQILGGSQTCLDESRPDSWVGISWGHSACAWGRWLKWEWPQWGASDGSTVPPTWQNINIINIHNWLVVWNICYFSIIYWECHHPNWRTYIFQRGRYTANQYKFVVLLHNFPLKKVQSHPINNFNDVQIIQDQT